MKAERLTRLCENISAISAEFHQDGKRFDLFYRNHGSKLSGFPGIWKYCVDMGEAFTAAEDKKSAAEGWIEAITAYVAEVLESGECPGQKGLRRLAAEAIAKARA